MMDECKVCANADNEYCFACDNGNSFKPMTNADRIRSMTDEELAEWVWSAESDGRAYGPRGRAAWLRWLQSPVEVDNGT